MTPLAQFLGESPPIVALRDQVSRLLQRQAEGARRRAPILILGETGTGKGLLAGAIHGAGPRAAGPFVDVNCAAIPGSLLESELFGFERGAFTDARQAKAGLFQTAHRGTLFLDEVGLLPEALQAKLLKVLEEQTVRRLGSTRSEAVDVWLIAATSENLEAAVQARRFREDLYHRLAVVTLRLPPLRERGEDIRRLGERFLARACEDYGLAAKALSADARAALQAYAWPGNVRELANVMERVALLSDGTTVSAETLALPSPRTRSRPVATGAEERQAIVEAETQAERSRVLEALRAVKWNISQAAIRLGMPRNTLRYRIDKLGLGPSPSAPGPPTEPVETPPAAAQEVRPPAAPAGASMDARIRWEPRRVTLMRVRLMDGAKGGSSESRQLMEVIVDKVRSFGGQIDALAATGLVAAFGLAPLEDAARHAGSCALAIQKVAARAHERDSASPTVVLAIHTTLVPVGHHPGGHEIDADAKRPLLAVLEALVDQADAGAVVASGDAAPFLTRRFELTAGGSTDSGEVYRLLGPVGPERGFTTGFVGRQAELALLGERFRQAEAGHGQIVSIVGEPGIGKSRLLREFRRQVAGRAAWREGQGLAFGQTIAFHPLIDLMRRAARIDEADPEGLIVEKVERAVLRLGEDLRPALPFVRYLLSVDPGDPTIMQLDPQQRRAGVFDAMRRCFARAAERRPLVVVWEDLHWADQATEEFVALMADGLAAHRVLMIVTGRPGYSPPARDRAFHTRLALTALSRTDSMAMARGLLSVDELPEALQTLLVRRAEGNPFFLEELLHACQETGAIRREGDRLLLAATVDDLALPDTLQDLIRARIERLSAAPRRVLDVAAVIGREFARRVVDRLADSPEASERALRELTAADLIHEKGLFPEVTFEFKHAVTHEVAYETLSSERRAELHRSIGLALEALYGDRLAEHAEVLARHFSKAEAWPKALAYLQTAARKAAHAFAIREALALYDLALEAAEQSGEAADPAIVIEAYRAKSTLHFVVSEFDRSRAAAEQVVRLAHQAGDRMREAKALSRIAWGSVWQRDLNGAVAHAREAIRVAGPIGGEEILARAYFTIGYVAAGTGGLAEAREAIAQALAFGRSSGVTSYLSMSLSVAGLLKSWEGEYADASHLQAEGLRLARDNKLLVPQLFSFFYHGLTLSGQGEYDRALALFHEGLTLAEHVGDEAIHYSRLLNCLGWLHLELGDFDRAIELSRRSAEMVDRGRHDRTLRNAEINLGNIHLAKGDLVLAGEFFESAYRAWDDLPSQWMRWRYSMRLFTCLGELWKARGDPTRAREFADRGLELATSTNSRKNLVKAWRLRGEIALAHREFEEAEIALRQALGVASAIGNPTQLWKTQLAWGHFCAARGRPDAAGDAYRAARTVLDRIKAGLQDPALRASLTQVPAIRQVYELAGSG